MIYFDYDEDFLLMILADMCSVKQDMSLVDKFDLIVTSCFRMHWFKTMKPSGWICLFLLVCQCGFCWDWTGVGSSHQDYTGEDKVVRSFFLGNLICIYIFLTYYILSLKYLNICYHDGITVCILLEKRLSTVFIGSPLLIVLCIYCLFFDFVYASHGRLMYFGTGQVVGWSPRVVSRNVAVKTYVRC